MKIYERIVMDWDGTVLDEQAFPNAPTGKQLLGQ